MARNQQNQQRQQPQMPIVAADVRLEQVGRAGATLKGKIAATTKRGNQTVSNVDTYFKVGGVLTPNSPLQSGDDGTASDDFEIPFDSATGRVLIEAWTQNQTSPSRKFLDVTTAAKPPTPKPVNIIGLSATDKNDGKWMVSIATWTQDKFPVPRAAIQLSYAGKAKIVITDENGFAKHSINVTTKNCRVVAQAPGTQKTLDLPGPKEKIEIPEGMSFLNSIFYRFWKSNNFRLGTFWVLLGIHWIVNHFFLNPPATPFSDVSDVRQEFLNLYLHGQAVTDYARLNGWDQFKMDWFSKSSTMWWWEFLLVIIYTPIALREEVGRAWTVAFAKKEVSVDMPDEPSETVKGDETKTKKSRGEKILEQIYVFARELFTATLAERWFERRVSA